MPAGIFISLLSYCRYITLEKYNKAKAVGLSARSVLARFPEIPMIDVTIPTTDGRWIHMKRHTKPEKLLQLLLKQSVSHSPVTPHLKSKPKTSLRCSPFAENNAASTFLAPEKAE